MLADTIESGLTLRQLQSVLCTSDLEGRLDDEGGELALDMIAASIVLREGFGHELIAVGDARSEQDLRAAVQQLAAGLQANALAYEFELYDRSNQLMDELKSPT